MAYDLEALQQDVLSVSKSAQAFEEQGRCYSSGCPELIYKCFREEELVKLYAIRKAIEQHATEEHRRQFLRVALTATLRDVTSAGAGWPYIAPSKHAERTVRKCAYEEFLRRCQLMLQDVSTPSVRNPPSAKHKLINGDARHMTDYVEPESIDLMLTSPPYLNNYDYADRTRLETYFWGIYENWAQITSEVRDHLIVAATTQISRTSMIAIRDLPGIEAVCPTVHEELMNTIRQLEEVRTVKRGRKSYDLMVAGYFEDMLKVIKEAYALLKKGCSFVLVLGDSAPYGSHVRTDEIIGELGVAVGFSKYSLEVIRTRGDKWAGNPQRHKVPLRESIVTIVK